MSGSDAKCEQGLQVVVDRWSKLHFSNFSNISSNKFSLESGNPFGEFLFLTQHSGNFFEVSQNHKKYLLSNHLISLYPTFVCNHHPTEDDCYQSLKGNHISHFKMGDLDDYDFSTGDAGASNVYNMEAGQIRVGGLVKFLLKIVF